MDLKRKDNLTDTVEALQGHIAKEPVALPPKGRQEVVDKDGEIVTLGQNAPKNGSSITNSKSHELSPSLDFEALKSIFTSAVDRLFKKWSNKADK